MISQLWAVLRVTDLWAPPGPKLAVRIREVPYSTHHELGKINTLFVYRCPEELK